MIFKSTRTFFISWRLIFSRAIKSIRDIRGITEAGSLEELITNLEKDIGEWSNLRQLDLTPLVEIKLERLAEQMQKNYLETSREVEALSQELKSLEAREAEVAEAMIVSSEVLNAARDQIKKAKKMIAKANLILSKAEPMSQAKTIRWKR